MEYNKIRYKSILLTAVGLVVASFVFTLLGYRTIAIFCIIISAIGFSFVFLAQNPEDNPYYSGKYARYDQFVDVLLVWAGTLTIAVFDNWWGLVFYVFAFPISKFWR